jgi:hypothetical protein
MVDDSNNIAVEDVNVNDDDGEVAVTATATAAVAVVADVEDDNDDGNIIGVFGEIVVPSIVPRSRMESQSL